MNLLKSFIPGPKVTVWIAYLTIIIGYQVGFGFLYEKYIFAAEFALIPTNILIMAICYAAFAGDKITIIKNATLSIKED